MSTPTERLAQRGLLRLATAGSVDDGKSTLVGQDERPLVGGEVPVGDVDRDALLALGAQPVGDGGQVGRRAVAVRV